MKKFRLIFSLGLFLVSISTTAQSNVNLIGRWKMISYGLPIDSLKLNMEKSDPTQIQYSWGYFIEFASDGTFTQSASAPCGLDDGQFTYSGKWKYDKVKKILMLYQIKVIHPRPNIYHHYEVLSSGKLRLTRVVNGVLHFRVEQPWEKVKKRNN